MATRKAKKSELTQAADHLAAAAHQVGDAVTKKLDEFSDVAAADLGKAKRAVIKKRDEAKRAFGGLLKKAQAQLNKAEAQLKEATASAEKSVRSAEKKLETTKKSAQKKLASLQTATQRKSKAVAKAMEKEAAGVKKAAAKKTKAAGAAKKNATRKAGKAAARAKTSVKKAAMGGVRSVAEILNFMGTANESTVVDAIREYDPDLAQKVLDEMFVFENLLDLDDRSIQMLLREIQSDSLILALKGSSEGLREKIFKNMSQRAAEMLREDLEAKGPVRVSEVEAEQKEILKIVRRLADEGQIVLGGKGDDQFV